MTYPRTHLTHSINPIVRAWPRMALGALVLLAAIVGGCGHRPYAKKVEPVPSGVSFPALADSWQQAGLRLDWVGFPFAGLSTRNGVTHVSPHDDVVLVLEKGSRVCCLEGNTGQIRWTNELDNPLTRFVGLTRDTADGNRVIASSESEAFVLSVANGGLMAREKFEKVVSTAPVVDGLTAIYGTGIGEVLAHRLGAKLKAWGFKGRGTIESNPVRFGEYVGIVSQLGDVMIFEPRSGTLVGRARIFGGLATNPVVAGDAMYIASIDQSVWAIRVDGSIKWRYRTETPLRHQPTVVGRTLVLDVPASGLTALDLADGSVKWSNPSVHGVAVCLQKNRLLVHDGETLHVLDPARGDIISSSKIPGIARLVADKPEDGNVFAISDTNLIGKLRAR